MNEQIDFYERLLEEEPTNIDARLRLASLWKACSQPSRAVQQYALAGRQLAAEGLLMEAIAACKAIIELDPNHTETLLFLASLYARKPEASRAARVVEVITPEKPPKEDVIVLEPSLAVEELDEHDLMVLEETVVSGKPAPNGVSHVLAYPQRTTVSTPEEDLRQTDELKPLQRPSPSSPSVPYPERVLRRALNISLPGSETAVPARSSASSDIDIPILIEEEGQEERGDENGRLTAEEEKLIKGDATWGQDDTVVRPFTLEEIEAVFSSVDETDMFRRADPNARTQEAQALERRPPSSKTPPVPPSPPSRPPQVHLSRDTVAALMDDHELAKPPVPNEANSAPRYRAPRQPEPPIPRVKQTYQRMAPPVGLSAPDLPKYKPGYQRSRPAPPRPATPLPNPRRSQLLRTQIISPASNSISRADIPPTPLFSRLSPDTFVQLLKRIHLRRVPAGETILSDLDHSRQALFLIVNGSVDVLRRNEDGTRTYLAELSRGEFFGEFQLLTGRSRQALVRAANTVDLLVLDKDVITDLAEESPDIWKVLWDFYHARLLNNLLAGSSLFRSMSVRERDRIVHLFERLDVSEGQLVIRQGEFGVGIYLLLQGEMVVLAKEGDGGAPRMVTTLSSGDFFGTISALTDQPCAADVRATEVSILLFLKRDDLAKILQANPKVDEAFRTLVADRDVWVGQTGYSRFGIIKFTD